MNIPAIMKQYATFIKSEPGEYIITEGTCGDSFFYIITGRVKIAKKIGEKEEILRELLPGDFFGELALIHDKPRAASVIATELTELYEIGRDSFSHMLRGNPEISMNILCTSSNWLLESDRQYIEKLQQQTAELAILLQQKDQLTRSLEQESRLLAQEKEKYRSLVENSLMGVFVQQKGVVVFANNRFLEMTGHQSMDALEGVPVEDLFVPDSRLPLGKDCSGEGIEHYEAIIRTQNGEERTCEIRTVQIVMNNEQALLANAQDLTEKKRLEKENEKARFQLVQESKLASIGVLSAGIAHNLNNPLASIYTVAQLIVQEHPDMDEANRIIEQCRNMMNIIKNLMIKSRMDQSDELITININTLLENELKFYEANLDFKHTITKEYLFGKDLPSISGIYSDFSQAIMNIVQNAVDAMHESHCKKLMIKTHSDAENIYIDIADTGCGIPEAQLDKIFIPFFTTKPAMSEKKGNEPAGTGLGLASTHQLIQKYGGSISVKSAVGAGTTVTLCIPFRITP